MSMYIEIKINDRLIYKFRVSNIGGVLEQCDYDVETAVITGNGQNEMGYYTLTEVAHDRRDGALVLAMKAIHELELYEKRQK